MSRTVNVPKPPWREMVSPYERDPTSPTIRSHLEHFPGWLWAHRHACECSKAVPLYPFIERYGLDLTFDEVKRLLRCTVCRECPDGFTVPSPTGSHGHGVIPLNRVPGPMRSYALVDPKHWPAPLRGAHDV